MSSNWHRLAATAAASLLLSIAAPYAAESALDTYGRLLSAYVTPGGVRYEAWRAAPEDVRALSGVVRDLSAQNPKTLTAADRTALYIDLYNAKVLEIVVTKNPKTSIKEVTPGLTGFGVFLKPAVELGGKTISLRDLEETLRKDAKDPRIHFAINCASKSCPPIAADPYRGATLDAQLDRSVRAFLTSPGALVATGDPKQTGKAGVRVECSKIFDWYSKDFDAAGGAVAFLEKNAPAQVASSIRDAKGSVKLVYQEYDWSLNRAP